MDRKSLRSVLLALPAVLSACDGSGTEALDDGGSQQTPVVAPAGTETEAAAAEVVATVARFHVVSEPDTDPSGASSVPISVLSPPTVRGFVRDGASFVPLVGGRGAAPVLRLPLTADGAFRLTHPRRNLAIEVTLEGTSSSPGVPHEGYVVYRDVDARGADVVHRATEGGTEDFVLFERAPEAPEVRYRVDLGEGVAGVRVVERTVEMLDASGTPRLRMSPPWLVDASGKWHEAAVDVSACDIDVDPRAPWGRRPVTPRSDHCLVGVSWHGGAIAYPAVLDPIWSTTADMTVARSDARAGLLADGRVMVAGDGRNPSTPARRSSTRRRRPGLRPARCRRGAMAGVSASFSMGAPSQPVAEATSRAPSAIFLGPGRGRLADRSTPGERRTPRPCCSMVAC